MKFFTFIVIGTFSLLTACSSTDSSTSEDTKKNYEHYTGGNFDTMQSCLELVTKEAQSAGMKLVITTDRPEKVTGAFNGDGDMFFYCEKKETGTNGTFFEVMYPKIK